MARNKSGRKSNTRKKQHCKFIFRDVQMNYFAGIFVLTIAILRQAGGRPPTKAKAQQLHINTTLHLAFETFIQNNCKEVISKTQSLLKDEAHPKTDKFSKKLLHFLSLSHLSLGSLCRI